MLGIDPISLLVGLCLTFLFFSCCYDDSLLRECNIQSLEDGSLHLSCASFFKLLIKLHVNVYELMNRLKILLFLLVDVRLDSEILLPIERDYSIANMHVHRV